MRRSFTALVASVMVVLLCGMSAPVASAGTDVVRAPTCWGDWCSGQDPEATGCSADAYTVVHARIPGTYTNVELRWSPTCRTNWARTQWNNEATSTALRARQCPTGYTQGYSGTNGTFWWSKMIYSPSMGVSAQWIGPPGSVGTACA